MMNQYLTELSFYLGRAYPSFVYRKNPDRLKNFVPVFISHSVTHKDFEAKLSYLKENNYRTITVSGLYEFITGRLLISDPTVCLTFDDVHISLYNVGFPLLKKYGMTASAFVVPAFIGNPNWITWDQIKEMSESGIIDIQSHTNEHKRIFVGDKVLYRNRPGLFKNDLWLDRPTVIINGIETKDIPLDYPIYQMDSRMSQKLRYLENNKWETSEDQKSAILNDLLTSKKTIEANINKPVLHLAYPWGIGSALSIELSKKTGYLTNFFGPTYGNPYNKAGSDPYKLVRLKDDYIFRLPGANRIALKDIFAYKFARRKNASLNRKDIY